MNPLSAAEGGRIEKGVKNGKTKRRWDCAEMVNLGRSSESAAAGGPACLGSRRIARPQVASLHPSSNPLMVLTSSCSETRPTMDFTGFSPPLKRNTRGILVTPYLVATSG